MAIEVFNRYEQKYVITDDIYQKIRPVLEDYMEVDKYSKNGDLYTICNIYYDTPNNDIIRTSIDKPLYKEKLRLRSYGVVKQTDKVFLEIKKKYKGLVNKRRTSILLGDAYQYINTKKKPEIKHFMNEQILTEIDYMIQKNTLQPALFLSYDRNALFGMEDPNFRVTFDTNLKTRRYDVGLDYGNYGEPLLPRDYWIMEAKTDKAVPLWFAQLLSSYRIYPASFSKYGTEYKKYILHEGSHMTATKD